MSEDRHTQENAAGSMSVDRDGKDQSLHGRKLAASRNSAAAVITRKIDGGNAKIPPLGS